MSISLSISVFAETIVFKWGTKVEAKIIEKTDKYIRVEMDDSSLVYKMEDIENIDGKHASVHQEASYPSPIQYSTSTTDKERLSLETYLQRMTSISVEVKRIMENKLLFAGRETAFIPKSNTVGNAVALGFYDGQKGVLEDLKKQLLLVNPPPELIETHELFKQAINYNIAAYEKAIEAHEKDNINIMENEGAYLMRKATKLMLEVFQALKKWKEKLREI